MPWLSADAGSIDEQKTTNNMVFKCMFPFILTGVDDFGQPYIYRGLFIWTETKGSQDYIKVLGNECTYHE